MAEIAAFGLAAAIIQFLDFSSKVVKCLYEFESNLKETSNTFSDLIILLPLLRNILHRLCSPTAPSYLNEQTEEVLVPAVKRGAAQLESLEELLSKAIPNEGETSFNKRWKALCSLSREKKVKETSKSLCQTLNILTLHQSVHTSYLSTQLLGRLATLEETARTVNESDILEGHPTRQPPSRIGQPGAEESALQMLLKSNKGDCINGPTQTRRQAKRRSINSDRSGTLCLNDRCICSCHAMLSKSGRFWSWKFPSLAKLFSACDRPTCGNKIIRTSFHVSLSRFNILRAIDLMLSFAWGESGCAISLVLRPARIVKYTSPGFVLLWKCETGQLQWPEARTILARLFDEKEASLEDIDPSGKTWLEVSCA